MNTPHSSSLGRERERLPITLVKLKIVYGNWLRLHRDFPKAERFGIGQKIERAFLTVLELIFLSSFSAAAQKIPLLTRAISQTDVLKFFIQLAWENRLFTTEHYSTLIVGLEEVGKMLYGWRKGYES